MKFHGLLMVRDEEDIIQQCLEHLVTWCDAVYIYDTGSVDNTWEIIQCFALQDTRIIPVQKKETIFHNDLRAYLFSNIRKNMNDGDWCVRVDADEFYHITPPDFVDKHLKNYETCVYNQSYDFRFTEKDLTRWKGGYESIEDRKRPIEDRRRFYIPLKISEPRMFRYRSTMKWGTNTSFPYNAGFVARQRIPIRHYPHRDPKQMQRRSALRSIMAQLTNDSINSYRHWLLDWQQLILDNNSINLHYWEPGMPLPVYRYENHLPRLYKRFLQRIAHSYFLPILDQIRPEFPNSYQTKPIPPAIQQQLETLL